jgi:hypothetical protein
MSNNDKSNINSFYNTKYFIEHTDDILNDSFDNKDSIVKTNDIHSNDRNTPSNEVNDILSDDYDYKESPAFSKFFIN